MGEMRQELYLIADEMRGMATLGKEFAGNVYEVERAHRMAELAAKVAALADAAIGQRRHAVGHLIVDAFDAVVKEEPLFSAKRRGQVVQDALRFFDPFLGLADAGGNSV